MRSRRNNKVSIWLVPFYAVFIIVAAACLLVYTITLAVVSIVKAVRQTRKVKDKPVKAAPVKSKRERDFEDIEDRWEGVKPRGKTETRWRGPTKTSDGTRVVHKVGGRRVLGKIVDIDDLADPRPPPPEPALVGAADHDGWDPF